MSRLNRTSICLLIICSAIIANPSSALAFPALPSSFYGTVKLNNTNVPDGTVIQAYTGDLMIAQGYTQTYQGASVYALNVPADNADTPVIDGGREGDRITFKAGGIIATETGTWHSATNVPLNLTITSTSTPWEPQATPTEPPTQTPIVMIQPPLNTLTPAFLASPTVVIPSLDTLSPDLPTVISGQPTQQLLATDDLATGSLDTMSPDLPIVIPGQPTQQLPATDDLATDSDVEFGKTILSILALAGIAIIGAGLFVRIRRRN